MKLENVFARVLREPVDKISDETSPQTTKRWDSFYHIQIVTALEETYNVTFDTGEIEELKSVGLVRKALRAKGVDV